MQHHSRQDLYRTFIEFIRLETQRERSIVNRRMLSVFFWCFFLPAIISVTVLVLIKVNALPRRARGYLDWLVLFFPLAYSIYFLSSEVLSEVPAAFKRGGMATTLGQSLKEGEWREKVCEGMKRGVHASHEEWRWIVASFKMDLELLQYRTRYLTALAGAVFFLIMQGIDSLTDSGPTVGTGTGEKVTWVKDSILGWIETTGNDITQFVGLALFLVLLYLSGSQTYHSLRRYLNCAELMILDEPDRD